MSKQIDAVIERGKIKFETKGYVGTECMDAVKGLKAALGNVESEDPTPEFHQQEVRQVTN